MKNKIKINRTPGTENTVINQAVSQGRGPSIVLRLSWTPVIATHVGYSGTQFIFAGFLNLKFSTREPECYLE